MEITTKLAHEVADAAAAHADRHDAEGSFVSEGITAAREIGYLAAPVPTELGGEGATTRDVADAQRVIAAACGSTALASAMHLHVVLAAAWRWRHGDTSVEPMLRRVAGERLVVCSTGGNDWTKPTAVATPVDGGWRVSGRKTFASISPIANVAATFAVIGEPRPGAEVIAFSLPLKADGVRVEETWDAAGMRGTGSNEIVLDDVFVAEAQVSARRTWGELDRPLLVTTLHAFPVIAATYLGVAEALFDTALASGKVREIHARDVGLADAHLRTARWSLYGCLDDLGDDPQPSIDTFHAIQQMKRTVTVACQEVASAASEFAGGGAYAKRGSVDRMVRDLRAAVFHPYPPELTLVHAGKARLGLPIDTF